MAIRKKDQTIYMKVLRPQFMILEAESQQAAVAFVRDNGLIVLETSLNPLEEQDNEKSSI